MDLKQERRLVERAQDNVEAFGELYDEYYDRIFNYILRRTGRVEIASDVTSNAFFKALTNIDRFKWREVPFSSWLYRIATNETAAYFRKNGHESFRLDDVLPFIPAGPSAESEVVEAEAELLRHREYLALHGSISELPLKYQEVITLRFFEDKQVREIAEILGKREGTVKSLIHRGLERLRKTLPRTATF